MIILVSSQLLVVSGQELGGRSEGLGFRCDENHVMY